MEQTRALEIISLLAGVWVSKTDGPISQAFAAIAKTASEAVEQSVQSDGGGCACKKPIATTSTQNLCGNCGKPRRR